MKFLTAPQMPAWDSNDRITDLITGLLADRRLEAIRRTYTENLPEYP